MKVLVLHSRYLSGDLSGENRVVSDEVRLLQEAGHEVIAWQPSISQSRLGVRLGADAVWSMSAARRVRALVAEHRPNVVHVHSLFPRLSPAVLRAVPRNDPMLMTLHNFRAMCLPATYLRDGAVCELCAGRAPWRGVLYACYRDSHAASAALASSLVLHRALRSFSRVDLFLAVSQFVRDKHVEAGFDPARIRVKPNFAWPAERRQGPGDSLLFLGRLSPEKGLDTVIAALPERLELVVAGDGPERSRLESGARGRVKFIGQVSGAEVPKLLQSVRALVVPSRSYEGQPRVILEAFAAGVPVIASRLGGLVELVDDDVNGYLVEGGNDRAWRSALERVSRDEESERLGRAAHAVWEQRFSPSSAIRHLETCYAEAASVAERTRRTSSP